MRHTSKPFATMLISAAAGAALATGSVLTFAASPAHAQQARVHQLESQKLKNEEIKQAEQYLEKARDLLSKADHDQKGYDYKAYESTQQALKYVRTALGEDSNGEKKD
jgi:hypothetical protein